MSVGKSRVTFQSDLSEPVSMEVMISHDNSLTNAENSLEFQEQEKRKEVALEDFKAETLENQEKENKEEMEEKEEKEEKIQSGKEEMEKNEDEMNVLDSAKMEEEGMEEEFESKPVSTSVSRQNSPRASRKKTMPDTLMPPGGRRNGNNEEPPKTRKYTLPVTRRPNRVPVIAPSSSKKKCTHPFRIEYSVTGDRLYCLCRIVNDDPMIGCDCCDDWFHFKCVGLDSEPTTFICPRCSGQKLPDERKLSRRDFAKVPPINSELIVPMQESFLPDLDIDDDDDECSYDDVATSDEEDAPTSHRSLLLESRHDEDTFLPENFEPSLEDLEANDFALLLQIKQKRTLVECEMLRIQASIREFSHILCMASRMSESVNFAQKNVVSFSSSKLKSASNEMLQCGLCNGLIPYEIYSQHVLECIKLKSSKDYMCSFALEEDGNVVCFHPLEENKFCRQPRRYCPEHALWQELKRAELAQSWYLLKRRLLRLNQVLEMFHIRVHERDARRYAVLEQKMIATAPAAPILDARLDNQNVKTQASQQEANDHQRLFAEQQLQQQQLYAEQQALASQYLKQQLQLQQQHSAVAV